MSFVVLTCSITAARADDLAVKLISVTRPVHPGGEVVLVVQTQPGATCTGARQGHFGNDYSIPLQPKSTGADGRAQWQWSVLNGKHPIGLRGVRVTCSAEGRSGALETQFDVE